MVFPLFLETPMWNSEMLALFSSFKLLFLWSRAPCTWPEEKQYTIFCLPDLRQKQHTERNILVLLTPWGWAMLPEQTWSNLRLRCSGEHSGIQRSPTAWPDSNTCQTVVISTPLPVSEGLLYLEAWKKCVETGLALWHCNSCSKWCVWAYRTHDVFLEHVFFWQLLVQGVLSMDFVHDPPFLLKTHARTRCTPFCSSHAASESVKVIQESNDTTLLVLSKIR